MRRARPLWAAASIAAIALGLTGCGPIGWIRLTVNHPLDAREVAFIVPGQATWSEVTSRLGAPSGLAPVGDGFVADYSFSDSRSFSLNLGWPLRFIAPVSYVPHDLAFASEGIGIHSFQVAVDARGIVKYADFRRGEAASQYRLLPFADQNP